MMTCPHPKWSPFKDDELKEMLEGIVANGFIHTDLFYDLTKEIENRKSIEKTIDEDDE